MSTTSGSALPTSAFLRNRMSWVRTGLAVIVTGFLLVRGGLVNSEAPVLAVLATVISVIVIATALARIKTLGQAMPPVLADHIPRVITASIVAFATIALLRMILPT